MMTFPDPDVLIALAPEDLAWFVLAYAKERESIHQDFTGTFERGTQTNACQRSLSEAFAWLVANQLLVPMPGDGSRGYYFISRKGFALDTPAKLKQFQEASAFPAGRLHAKIAASAMPSYLRGDLGPAVLLAFKEVEVAVREASGIVDLVGVKLMHAAFAKDAGPLTDTLADGGEQTALGLLFAGAIGSFKNPHSHRSPTLDDPTEAADLLILASRLISIVEKRATIRQLLS